MREILFRGKRIEDGQWVEGHYHFANWYIPPSREVVNTTYYILQIGHGDADEIDPNTVGQFTGLTDKNGKKIFEGDIVRDLRTYLCHKSYFERGYKGEENYEKYRKEAKPNVVSFISENFGSCGCCFDSFVGSGFAAFDVDLTCCEVVGNIHENPELLENP